MFFGEVKGRKVYPHPVTIGNAAYMH